MFSRITLRRGLFNPRANLIVSHKRMATYATPSRTNVVSEYHGDILTIQMLSLFRPIPLNPPTEMYQLLPVQFNKLYQNQHSADRVINVEPLELSSVLKKRRKKMRKHKDRKRWKKTRTQRRRRIQIKKQAKLERESKEE